METSPVAERRFLRTGLPWVVAAAALLIYLATLNHWVTLNSLPVAARVNGWDWRPTLSQPLLFLLTYPCRCLPVGSVLLALNLFAALCASLTLALLARTVALLPHNRLQQQRLLVHNQHALLHLPNAWVPPVLAAVASGLQLTFWENATAASAEMLDLLLFACLIRCLLEYRIDRRQSWLDRAGLVCGLALANSWAMVAFLPLFLVTLLRTRRLSFFNLDFLGRMARTRWKSAPSALAADFRFFLRLALFGLTGLSLFLLLPLVQTLSPDSPLGFGPALRAAASSYKNTLLFLSSVLFVRHREVSLLLAAVSLLPLLVLSIRWRRQFNRAEDPDNLAVTTLIFYASHALLLLICLWVAFDPPLSPRQISRRLGVSLPFLPLYYLSAVCIGYYSGFFLLIFGSNPRRGPILQRVLRVAVPKLVYALLGLTLAGLLLKNFLALRASNGPQLDQYARWAASSLPPEGAVVLSDDPTRLAVLRAELARGANAGRYLLVETPALALASYRAHLRREYPPRWPEPDAGARSAANPNALPDAASYLQLMTRLAQSNRVFYLQPAFGLLLERFYLEPRGLIYELKPCPTNVFSSPPPTSADLAENQAFWQHAIDTGINPLLPLVAQPDRTRRGLGNILLEWGQLQMPPPAPAKALALWCSSALNGWGVTLQRNGRWPEATPCFALARRLNPDNLPAQANLLCNSNLLAGRKMTVLLSKASQEQFGKYRNWSQILANDGPFDEPGYCYQLGLAYAEANLLRQAGQQFERAMTLAPGDLTVRLLLGELLNRCRLPDQALQLAARTRSDPTLQPLSPTAEAELSFLQAEAWFAKTNFPKAAEIIHSLLASHPGDADLLSRAAETFAAHHSYSNALQLADQQLRLTPDDLVALLNKGTLCLLAGDFSNAVPPLTRALSLTNSYPARLNRALAYFRSGHLDAAEADYQALVQAFPADYQAFQGLAEIARLKKDTNAAIRYYQRYLDQAAADSPEARAVAARLKSLQ